jgi:signal transduction histidine kinase
VDNASRVMDGGEIVVALESRRGYSSISVRDQGPGLPEDDLPLVFDRFFRSEPSRDRSTGGAGLGLAIVKAIVEAHAGTISAANRPEGGSEFTLRLPSVRDDGSE